ncbi:unnamed protein product [Mucor hiemalis]
MSNQNTRVPTPKLYDIILQVFTLINNAMTQELKRQQVNSLLAHNPTTTVVADGQMYEVPLSPEDKTFY